MDWCKRKGAREGEILAMCIWAFIPPCTLFINLEVHMTWVLAIYPWAGPWNFHRRSGKPGLFMPEKFAWTPDLFFVSRTHEYQYTSMGKKLPAEVQHLLFRYVRNCHIYNSCNHLNLRLPPRNYFVSCACLAWKVGEMSSKRSDWPNARLGAVLVLDSHRLISWQRPLGHY